MKALEASKERDLWRFIHGLGIQHVGASIAKVLADTFLDMEKLAGATTDQLVEIDGIGDIVAQSIVTYFGDPRQSALVEELIEVGLTSTQEPPRQAEFDSAVAGKTFVITGKLPSLKKPEARELIEAAGGIVKTSVSKKTNFVVAGEKMLWRNPTTKLRKARELGIEILDEPKLLKLLEEE